MKEKVDVWSIGSRYSKPELLRRRKPKTPVTIAEVRSELIQAFAAAGIAYHEVETSSVT